MINNFEKELEDNFIKHFATTYEDNDNVGETGAGKISDQDMKEAGDILAKTDSNEDEENKKEDSQEDLFHKKPGFGEEEAQASEDVIPWADFKIILDPRYMQELEGKYAGQLNEKEVSAKAEAQSYYIRCAEGNKRVEGIWNGHAIGGYGTKEKLGEDLEWMKKMTVTEGGSPDSSRGLPRSEAPNILKDMEDPVVVTEQVKEELKNKEPKQEENIKLPENKSGNAPKANVTPQPNVPEPVGKASPSEMNNLAAKIKDNRIKRAKLLKIL